MSSPAIWLCTECCRLVEATRAGAYRSGAERPPCPQCEARALIDPADAPNLEVLATMDEHERMARLPRSVRTLGRATRVAFAISGLGVIFAMLLVFAFGWGRGEVVFEVMALLIAAVLAIPGALIALRSVRGYWERTRALPHPGRWALALPAAAGGVTGRGELRCEQPLRAPLSGETCAGYEVGVRYDSDADGPLGTWLLLEQRCADIEVGELSVSGKQVYLQLARQPFCAPEGDPRVDHFLRQRGIRAGRQTLFVYETRVGQRTDVIARRSDNGVVTLVPR